MAPRVLTDAEILKLDQGSGAAPVELTDDEILAHESGGEDTPKYPSSGNQFLDAFEQSGAEIARGFHKGSAAVMKPAAGAIASLNPASGFLGKFAGMPGIPDEANPARILEKNSEAAANAIPETSLVPAAKGAYNLIGEAPGLTAEFMQGEGLLKGFGLGPKIAEGLKVAEGSKAVQGISQAAELAVTMAAEKLDKGAKEAGLAAAEGGTIGLLFPVASEALNIGKKFGPKAAEWLITLVTKDPKAAKDFTLNPSKYTLNPFKEVPDVETVRKQLNDNLSQMREDFRVAGEDLRTATRNKIDSLSEIQGASEKALKDGSEEAMTKASAAAKAGIDSLDSAIHEQMLSTYDGALSILDATKKAKGEAVGHALSEILEKDPFVAVPSEPVYQRAQAAFSKMNERGNFPFVISEQGLGVKGKNAALDNADLHRFQNLYTEFMDMHNSGRFTVDYLQNLKSTLQGLADQYGKSGNGQLSSLYADFSRAVNPAKLITESPELSKQFSGLAEANKSFSDFIPKYENAISFFSKRDASGTMVPDMKKVISAVENNDVALLRRIRKAEAAIPYDARILPKVESMVDDVRNARNQAKATLKGMSNSFKKRLDQLESDQASIMSSAKAENREALLAHNRKARQTAMREKQTIDSRLSLLKNQEVLRGGKGGVFPFNYIAPTTAGLSRILKETTKPLGAAADLITGENGRFLSRFTASRRNE